jgi:hypothetical protein
MTQQFFKFPHTPHLAWLGPSHPRADKVFTPEEAHAFLAQPITVEEKIDGANLGISFESNGQPFLQNRGTRLGPSCHPQFQPLWAWLSTRHSQLHSALADRLILFGEWCFAVHSIHYNRLPDWFIAFDVFDRDEGGFWDHARRDRLLTSLGISAVPSLACGRFTLDRLKGLLEPAQSIFGDAPAEGLYLRQEAHTRLVNRAKLVRREFVQNIEAHWTSRPLEKNSLA